MPRRDVLPTVDTSGSPLPGAAHPLPTLAAPRAGRAPPTHLTAPHEPATADHHGWPRRAGMVPLGTAQLRRYLVLAWRVLALHALESPTLPLCGLWTSEAAHLGRYTAVTLGADSAGSSRQHVRRVVCAWLEPTCV